MLFEHLTKHTQKMYTQIQFSFNNLRIFWLYLLTDTHHIPEWKHAFIILIYNLFANILFNIVYGYTSAVETVIVSDKINNMPSFFT